MTNVTSTWGRLRGAVAVASLVARLVLCVREWGCGTDGDFTDAAKTKPASKSKTASSGQTKSEGTSSSKSEGPAKTSASKTTKGKSTARAKDPCGVDCFAEADGADDPSDERLQGVGAVASDGAAVGDDAGAVGL